MSSYIAKWGTKRFEVTKSKIVPVQNLTTKFARKSDSNGDTSGTAATNTRGLELQTITLQTTYIRGAGIEPRQELESWESCFGKFHPLYINGTKFGPSLMELDSVEFPNIILDKFGRFLQVDAVITFISHKDAKSTAKTSSSSKSSNSKALSAKPTSTEKAAKTASTRKT